MSIHYHLPMLLVHIHLYIHLRIFFANILEKNIFTGHRLHHSVLGVENITRCKLCHVGLIDLK